MHHHHHSEHLSSVENDERAVTKWLNTMEASLANPNQPVYAKYSLAELRAIDHYATQHRDSLSRYDRFLPSVGICMDEN